ncbi:MAG: hypothetical protein J6C96_11550, partial [Oscillospiraceae bacterium]|nr:hypothetical protein [Oscillospiraceae bacterium]
CPFEGKKPCLGQNMMRFFTFLQEKRLFQAGREFFYLGMLFIQRFLKSPACFYHDFLPAPKIIITITIIPMI